MADNPGKSGSDLFIVDNSDNDWKVRRYLHDWCQLAKSVDIATGFFEIGALLALDPGWKQVEKFRILMGDEVSKRTKQAFLAGLSQITRRLDASLEAEKETDSFLAGVPAIVEAIRSNRIECRVYREKKFHAKAYITTARQEVVGAFALVGSSNFTYPGLVDNVELNVQIVGHQVRALQDWYERHWNSAEDVSTEVLRTIERHTIERTPFEVYAKALQEFFRGHEMTADEWERAGAENGGSRMYSVLDPYQREGYHNLLKIGDVYRGALLCDGVGLGKTFIGLMLIERLIRDRKRVMLLVPKGARDAVWEPALRQYLPHLYGDFSNLVVFSHTDLQRSGAFPERFQRMKELADAIIIDEAHHFRNPGPLGAAPPSISGDTRDGRIRGEGHVRPSRYRQLYDIVDGPDGTKQVFLLTATPINNKLADFRHMVELFSRKIDNYFVSVGVHSLRGHFVKMERELKKIAGTTDAEGDLTTDLAEAESILKSNPLFNALVVQRSRAYVKASQEQSGRSAASFPVREHPKIAEYSVKKTYGHLLKSVDTAFSKENPLFVLPMYYPLAYLRVENPDVDPFDANRQKQVVALIRAQFLKRFESSARAFERSCDRLLVRLLAFVTRHTETTVEKRKLDRWERQNDEVIRKVMEHQHELWGDDEADETVDDLVSEEMLEETEKLDRSVYRIEEMLEDSFLDLDQVVKFLTELHNLDPKHDDKLRALIALLKTDPVISTQKVLIFTEFADTARYLEKQLKAAGIGGVDRVDSGSKRNRIDIIRAFAPYYNHTSSPELASKGIAETRVLISTDVLSEGLNLQDATRMINYDLHWNPVRLMQRIGRVDRRLNPQIEKQLVADHPEVKELRGKVAYWNFLPPDDLDDLLRLYGRVAHKTLRISRTFGIEGRKLLRPEDEYDALREFNEQYEGTTTPSEALHLEFQRLLQENPGLEDRLKSLPGRVFSGKAHPSPDACAVFFCYALPARPVQAPSGDVPANQAELWSIERGPVQWYLHDCATGRLAEEPGEIANVIRSSPATPRHCTMNTKTLDDIRKSIEKHIKNTYLKQVQAPMGVKPMLRAWMELS